MAETPLIVLCALCALQAGRRIVRGARRRQRLARLLPSTFGGIVLVKAPLAPQAVRREVAHG